MMAIAKSSRPKPEGREQSMFRGLSLGPFQWAENRLFMGTSIRHENPWPPAGRSAQMQVDIFARRFFQKDSADFSGIASARKTARWSSPAAAL
jgi:hypothetical protein